MILSGLLELLAVSQSRAACNEKCLASGIRSRKVKDEPGSLLAQFDDSWWSGVPGLLLDWLQSVQLARVPTQEQYSFLYEALLEGLLCGNTGVPVERIATLVHSLRENETSGHSSVLEKEFKVPPGDSAHWPCEGSSVMPPPHCSPPHQWDGDGESFLRGGSRR